MMRLGDQVAAASRRGRVGLLGGDRGFGAVEVLVAVPVLVTVTLLMVVLGRVQEAGVEVTGAARDGARAASLSRTPDAATSAAREAVATTMAGQSLECAGGPATSVDSSGFGPGGHVQVTVECTVPLARIGFPGLPGSTTMRRAASSPVEIYRGTG